MSSTNWNLCVVCQNDTGEQLRSTDAGWKTLSRNIPKMYKYGKLKFSLSRFDGNGGNDTEDGIASLENYLRGKEASYHKGCLDDHNNRMVARAEADYKKRGEQCSSKPDADLSSPPCKRRSQVRTIAKKSLVCCFCDDSDIVDNLVVAGNYYADEDKNKEHIRQLTAKWIEMAKVVGNDDILRLLSSGDVNANELYYHKQKIKPCYQRFRKSYMSKVNKAEDVASDDSEWYIASSLNKILYHMREQDIENPGIIFEVKKLEKMYIDLLNHHGIEQKSHVTRFADMLLSTNENLEKRTVHKSLVVCFRSTVDTLISDSITDQKTLIKSIREVVIPIRDSIQLIKNTEQPFNNDTQISSVSKPLLELISLIVDGVNVENAGYSQPTLTISQLITSNFRKNANKRNKLDVSRRYSKPRETPFMLFAGLNLYSRTRSRSLIDSFHEMGVTCSYDRVLEVTKDMGDSLVAQFKVHGVFVPGNLRSGVFTILAKDNVDSNATSSTATRHYHGTSMTIMQYPTAGNTGVEVYKPVSDDAAQTTSKKVESIPDEYAKPPSVYFPKLDKLYATPPQKQDDKYTDNTMYVKGVSDEVEWLESVLSSLDEGSVDSWSKHHSAQKRRVVDMPGNHAILPLIDSPVHTLQTQHHCMQINKKTTEFLNPGQTPVDVCDQPVYALTWELQQRLKEKFGKSKYFCLFGGLHIEKILLVIHGELIKGSGLESILSASNLSIVGTGAMVNVNHIKQARYCLQVSVCAIYVKLREAHTCSGSTLSPMEWLKLKAGENPMCLYWKMILDLQIDILLFIRSIRESNFCLYVLCLKNLMKWMFAMDHYHYARWLSVHLFDLVHLHLDCPDVYQAFSNGKFSFDKTARQFSSMAPDQLHEQNNEVIKNVSGATDVMNREDQAGVERWGLCSPELAAIVSNFHKTSGKHKTENTKHHEDTAAFQKRFSRDVLNVTKAMVDNPFEQDALVKIDNTKVAYDNKVVTHLTELLPKGQEQFESFWNDRLVRATVAVDFPLKKNYPILPGIFESVNKEMEKKLVYPAAVLNKLREAVKFRPELATKLFGTELFSVSQSLAKSEKSLYHGTKSVLSDKFEKSEYIGVQIPAAIVIELSPLIRTQAIKADMKFIDFASSIYLRLKKLAKGYFRCDVIADRYFEQSLKENLRICRGSGTRSRFEDDTSIPSDFKENFLMNSANKHDLAHYLAAKFTDFNSSDEEGIAILVCTYGNSILTNDNDIENQDDVTNCISEEADQRIVRHVLNCSKVYSRVDALTIDTDVLALIISAYPSFKSVNESVVVFCGTGLGTSSVEYYNVSAIGDNLGDEVCNALSFFYAFTGCDTVSSFYGHSKSKFWDTWRKSEKKEEFTQVFQELSDQPTIISTDQLDVIEKFVVEVYYPDKKTAKLDSERKEHFMRLADPKLRSLPVSRRGLLEHTRRACLQAGWLWREGKSNVATQDPTNWGWTRIDGKFVPKWHTLDEDIDVLKVTQVCGGCKKALCKKCKCKTSNMLCLPFCACQQRCPNK